MTRLRETIVYVFLAVFAMLAILAALGGTKVIEMADGALVGFFLVLIGQCFTAIVAAFRTPDFFKEDPDCISRLKARHTEEIADLNAQILKIKGKQGHLEIDPSCVRKRHME